MCLPFSWVVDPFCLGLRTVREVGFRNPAFHWSRSEGVVRDACPVERPRRTRRELLKMLPLASAALLLDPSCRARAIRGGLALSDAASAALNAGALAPTYLDREVTPFD